MKLLEIVTMMNITENQEVQSTSFFHMKTGSGISVNEQLAKELHKPVIKKSKRRKVYARFKDNIWTVFQLKWNHCLQRTIMLNIYYV